MTRCAAEGQLYPAGPCACCAGLVVSTEGPVHAARGRSHPLGGAVHSAQSLLYLLGALRMKHSAGRIHLGPVHAAQGW